MTKTTLTDFKQNRSLKTKRWLGWLMFCMMLLYGQIGVAQIAYSQGWEEGELNSWVNSGDASFSASTTSPCEGTSGVRVNLYVYEDWDWGYYDLYDNNTFTSPNVGISDGTEVSMNFSYKVTDYSSAAPSSAANADSFQILVQWANSATGPWTTAYTINENNHTPSLACQIVNLSFTPGSGNLYVRFNSTLLDDYEDIHVYIDEVQVVQGDEPCFPPSDLGATNITVNSADLGWNSTATSFDIKWGIQGFNVDSAGTLLPNFVNGATLSNLSPNTSYSYYVRANCGNDYLSTWAGPFNFMTTQVPAALPYTDGFESTSGWSLINGTQTNKWFVGSATNNGGSQALYVSNDNGTSNVYGHTLSRVFAYRDIAIPATAEMVDFSFDWKAGGESTHDYIRVWVVPTSYVPVAGTELTAANSGGVQIGGYFNLNTEFTTANYQIPVTTYQGQTVRLVFEWRNDGSVGNTNPAGAIDNISIAVTACANPSELTATDITATAATLNWQASGNLFDIEIVVAGTTPTGIPSYTGINKPFTTTVPLNHSTAYEYYVRKDCGNGDVSQWAGPFVFATLCAVVDVPYVMPINATTGTDLPLCVTIENLNNDTSFWKSGAATSGIEGRAMRYQYHSSNVANDWMYTQALNLQAGQSYRLVFKHKISSTTYPEKLKVAYGSSAESTAMTTELFNQTLTTAPVALEEIDFIPTVTGTYYIGFQAYSAANMSTLYVGEISVVLTPTCFPPLNLEVDNITTYSAELTWEAPTMGNTATDGYVIEIRTAGQPDDPEGFVSTIEATDLTATLAGLSPGTAYTAYIKTLCTEDTDESVWESVSFVTACELPDAPANITFTDVTNAATKVNFEAPATAPTGYVIFRSTSDVPPVLVNGTTYSTNQTTAVASLTNGTNTYFCVYNGTDLVGNATSLASNTEYYYYVYSRSSLNSCFGAPWYSTTALTDSEVTAPATPTAAVVSNHAATSATVSWTASAVGGNAGAITYTLELYTDSSYENPVTGSPFVVGADVSYDLTGLTASTQYFFRIKANNTYHDSGYLNGNFTTTQVPATLDYEQDFEATHGWAFTNNDTHNNKWYVGAAVGNPGSSLYISNDGGVTNAYTLATTRVVHAYRDIAVPAGTTDAILSFDWKGEGQSNSAGNTQNDYFRVWLAPASYLPSAGSSQISSGSGRIQVGGNFNGETNWTAYENANVDLSSFAGQTMRLIFEWRNDSSGGTGNAAAIDNIEVALPDCSKPTDLAMSGVTLESVDLSWTSIGTTFDIKWGIPEFDVATEGTLVTGFANGGTLSGLEAETFYEYYVRQDCGIDGVSTWAGPYSIYTGHCIPTGSVNNSDEIRNFKLSNLDNSSAASEGINGYSDYTATVDAAELQASFSYVASLTSGSGSGSHGAAIWIDYNNDLVFDEDEMVAFLPSSISSSSTVSFPEFTVPYGTEPGIYRLRVQYHHNIAGNNLNPCSATQYSEIEDYAVNVLAAPTCMSPLNIEVVNITKNTAGVTWEAPELGNSPADGYEIEIRTAGAPGETPGLVTTLNTADLSATLSGLEPSTSYTVYIKSLCTEDTDESFWSEGVSFTTLCEYPDFELVNNEADLILCGPNAIELEVVSDGIVNWYDAADATEPIFTGTTFETDELTETTSFWIETVAEGGAEGNVGIAVPNPASTTSTTNNWGVRLTAYEATTLESVNVYSTSAGTLNVKITDGLGTELYETGNIDIIGGGVSSPNIIPLGFEVNEGNYRILIKSYSGVSLIRESSGVTFPYLSDDGVISITSSEWGGPTSDYYYYFYNIQYSSVCKSPREEVVVTVEPVVPVTAVEVVDITGPTATLEIESAGTLFDIEYGISGFEQGTGTVVTEVTNPYIIEGLTEDAVYDVYVRTSTYCGEWFGPTTFTATAPSEPQIIIAEDVTKVYGDAPFTHGSSDSGLALTYVIADQTVATFVGGQLVIQGAGETEVTAKQAGNSEFLPAEDVTFTLTVTKADLIVTAEDQTKVYDGEMFEDWIVIYEGFVYEDQASDLSGELVYEGDAATAINAGTYTIEVSGLLSDNYTINYEEGSLIITKATLEGITFEDQTVTYDGEEKSIFITGDLPDGVTVTYTGNEQTEVGDYDVTAHINGGTNYEDMELEAVMSIRGVLTDITFEDAEFTYDGTAKSIFITGDLPEGVTVTYTGNAQTEAGEYEVVANIEGGEFYSDLELTATLTISKATISGILFTDAEFVYNCTAHSLAITGELPEGVTVSYENNGNVESGTYTVTANINGGENYEDLTLTAVMTIEELLPTIADQFSCGALLVVDVEANLPSGWETKWYAGATSTDAIETILTSGVYYVSSSYNDCESSRIEVQVTIEDVSIPTGNAQQQFCISGQVSDLVVEHTTGTTLQVYETPTGGVALNANYSLYNGTFYVSEKIGDCESARLAIQVTITPSVPALSPAEFVICGHQLLSTIELDNLPNAELVWYANATTPQAMSASVQITSGTFYVSQKIGICESLRVPIVFEVQQVLPQPTATSIQQFCVSATVSELVATGAPNAVFKWYASATSATPLESTTALQNGTYYVSQELSGCESARRAVSVIITNLTAPQATSFEFCGSATVADFSMPVISGVTYNWYLPNQSTPLPSTHVLTNGNYLVKKAQNGCESNSAIVQVTIKPIPNSPTGQLEQEFIDSAMISDLEMDQPGVIWYITYEDALIGNNPLQANMPLQDGNVYYGVLIGANGCPSLPVAVTVTITLGVKDLDLASLKYYPNPVETELTVSYKAPINSLEVYDLTGKLIKTQTYDSNNVRLDVSSLSAGTYMIKVHTSVGSQFIKIVKK